MEPKRKSAIVVVLTCSIALMFALSVVTGSIKISMAMDSPINMISIFIACLAAFAAAMIGLIFHREKSKGCQNKSCSYHPQFKDEGGTLFKEMTGVLDMAELKDAQVAKEEKGATSDDGIVPTAKTDEATEVPQKQVTPKEKLASEVVAIDERDIDDEDLSDVEEPKDKPSMDFIDTMIPMIVTAMSKPKMQITLSTNQTALDNNMSGKMTAIEWLFEEKPQSGKHFKQASAQGLADDSKKATITRIDSVA